MRCKKCHRTYKSPSKNMKETQVCPVCSRMNFPTRDEVVVGSHVRIEKKGSKETGILIEGVVSNILTPGDYHPDGLMVDLTTGERGRVKMITRTNVSEKTKISIDKINQWINEALILIQHNSNGITENDLLRELSLNKYELDHLIPRLLRIEKIYLETVQNNSKVIRKLKFQKSSKQLAFAREELISKTNTEDLMRLTTKMIDESMLDKRLIDKYLRKSLTSEFVHIKSLAKMIQRHPELSKKQITRHVVTDQRLPLELKKLENNGTLHSNIECSLRIALFAVNYYDWDGEKAKEDAVIDLARSISMFLSSHKVVNQRFIQAVT